MIEEGEEDIKNGDLYTTDEVEMMLKSWIEND
jgi:predicted transcriptional regulator